MRFDDVQAVFSHIGKDKATIIGHDWGGDAWMLNVQNQSQVTIDNNPLAQLMIGWTFEQPQNPIIEEPEKILRNLKAYAAKYSIDYCKPLPQSPSWLTRALNEIKDNLRLVGITVDTDVRKHRKRYIQLEKDGATVWIGCKYCEFKYENGRDDKRIEHMKSVHSNICYIANCDEDLTSQESVEHIEGKHPGQHYN
jgi:hypothetical protein